MRIDVPCYIGVENAGMRTELLGWLRKQGCDITSTCFRDTAPIFYVNSDGVLVALFEANSGIDCSYDLELFKMLTTRNRRILDEVREWWVQTDFRELERITRYRQLDFDPEDSYQAFVDACVGWWLEKTDEERISIWRKTH